MLTNCSLDSGQTVQLVTVTEGAWRALGRGADTPKEAEEKSLQFHPLCYAVHGLDVRARKSASEQAWGEAIENYFRKLLGKIVKQDVKRGNQLRQDLPGWFFLQYPLH